MAWLSRVNFTASDVLSYTDLNNLGNDIRAWGGNVNGGGYTLSNVVLSASSGTMATVIGGTGTTSTLTMRSTSGVGTTGADIIFQTGNNGATEVMRLQNGGNVGIGTSSPQTLLTVGSYSAGTAEATTRGYIQIQDPTESVSLDGNRGLEFKNSPSGSGYGWKMGGVGGVNFAIGNRNNSATFAERMRIDSSGNVSIGVSTANTRLHVESDVSNTDGTGYDQGQLFVSDSSLSSSGLILGYRYQGGVAEYARIQGRNSVGATNIAMQAGGGNVGIGTSSPGYQLQLSTDSAAKPTTNTWTIASDSRLKTVKGEYQKGLTEICQVRPVRYEYNGKAGFAADGKEQVSILAQELMQVFPECVDTFKGKLEEDGPEIDLYNYNGHAITFALINAIKELKAEIDILKARN